MKTDFDGVQFPVIIFSYRSNSEIYSKYDDFSSVDSISCVQKIFSRKELVEHIARLNVQAWLSYYKIHSCPISEQDTTYYYSHIIVDKNSFESIPDFYLDSGDTPQIHFPESWVYEYADRGDICEEIRKEIEDCQSKIVENRKTELKNIEEEKIKKQQEEERIRTELAKKQLEDKERQEYIRLKAKYEN